MILDDPKAVRKAREQQEAEQQEREREAETETEGGGEGSQDSYPAQRPPVAPPPPAYEESSAPSSPLSPRSPITSSSYVSASFFPGPDSPTVPDVSTPLLQHHQPQSFQALPSTPIHRDSESEHTNVKASASRNADKRFMRALAVALIIYIVIATSVKSLINDLRGRGSSMFPSGPYPWGKAASPRAGDGAVDPNSSCRVEAFDGEVQTLHREPRPNWLLDFSESSSFSPSSPGVHANSKIVTRKDDDGVRRGAPYVSASMFTIPASKLRHFYIVSRGIHANGHVSFQQAETDKIVVQLEYYYWLPAMRSSMNLCHLVTNETSRGFGIFTPGNEWDSLPIFKRDIAFRITVFLPAKNHYLNPILESDLPNFNQTMEQFTYDFESVTLRGTNGWVRASEDTALTAKRVTFTTSNAPVRGNFSVSESLVLTTTNANIDSRALMVNNRVSHPTTADIRSSNAELVLRWDLRTLAQMPQGYGGAFAITSQTTNAEVLTSISSAPIDTSLVFRSYSTNAPMQTLIWRTLEGEFVAESNRALDIYALSHLKPSDDPKGMKRTPVMRVDGYDKGMVKGSFGWEHQYYTSVQGGDRGNQEPSGHREEERRDQDGSSPRRDGGDRRGGGKEVGRYRPPPTSFLLATTNGRHTITWT